MTAKLTRFGVIPLIFLLLGTAPPDQVIPLPGDSDEALILPANSPVKFQSFDNYGVAHFRGRFVLTGTFVYGCAECAPGDRIDPPAEESDLEVYVIPDRALAARLPHWRVHKQDVMIEVRRSSLLRRAIGTPTQRKLLQSGKLDSLRGHVAIKIDDFQTDIECDSVSYWANFVAIVRRPREFRNGPNGNYGCI